MMILCCLRAVRTMWSSISVPSAICRTRFSRRGLITKSAPQNISVLRNYGWVLWDCLTAVDRLRTPSWLNFGMSMWRSRCLQKKRARIPRRSVPIKKADAFLSGCSEVRNLADSGNVTVAIERASQILAQDAANDSIRSELAYLLGRGW